MGSHAHAATERIPAGGRATVDLPVSVLSNHTPITLSVQVIHGTRAGPTVFVSGAVHGDEIVGTAIIQQLAQRVLNIGP